MPVLKTYTCYSQVYRREKFTPQDLAFIAGAMVGADVVDTARADGDDLVEIGGANDFYLLASDDRQSFDLCARYGGDLRGHALVRWLDGWFSRGSRAVL